MRRLLRYLSVSVGSIAITLFLLIVLIGYTQPGLQLGIQLLQTFTPGKLTIHQASGQLFNRMQFNAIEYQYHDFQITLTRVTLHWRAYTALWRSLSVRQFTAERIQIKPLTSSTATMAGLSFPIEFGLNATGSFAWQKPFSNNFQIQLIPIVDAATSITGEINLQGDIHHLAWHATFTQPWPITMKGRLDDQWDVSWQATIEPIHSQGNITGDRNRPIITAHQQAHQLKLGDMSIEQATWRLYFEWDTDGVIQSELLIDNLINDQTRIDRLQLLLDGFVSNHQFKMHLQQPHQQWQTLIEGQYDDEIWQGHVASLHYQPVDVDHESWHFDQVGTLTVAPWRTPKTLQLNIPQLAGISQVWPAITQVSGQLHAEFNLADAGASDWSAQVTIKDAQVSLPEPNLTLKNLNFTATKPFDQPWAFKGEVTSGEGHVTVESTTDPNVLQVKGHQFLIMNTNEFMIKISPTLAVHWNQSPIKITGDILIPFARIKPLDYSQTIHLSSDVVFVDTDASQSSSTLQWLAEVKVTLGDDVYIDFSGISAQLVGQVHVVETPEQPTHATGQIDFVNGQFRYLNQTLKLDYGHIYYTNNLLDEPSVRVQASKELHTTTSRFSIIHTRTIVGVQVEGFVSDPQVKLFSNPAGLSQSDILSLLVLGKTISEASSGFDSKDNSALLVQAAGALGLESSDTVQQIQKSFGIDQLSLEKEKQTEVGSIGNVIEKTSLVIGKAITPRLFVSYHINLLGQQNRFSGNIIRFRYLLRPRLILQTETDGKDNAVDLLYIIELD